jgi:3-oxoacyl-(acyl-carrier-protein) synthase
MRYEGAARAGQRARHQERTPPVSLTAVTVCCTVAARAALLFAEEDLPGLRRAVSPLTGEPLPPAFLKNSDEQTVAALAAVFRALADSALDPHSLADWGVLAAPRFLGRATMGPVLERFREEGAWGISPHLIPHRSLHSVSGTISLALKTHGPNLGAGGGPGAESEAFAVAAALLSAGDLPGLCLVLTGHEPGRAPAALTAVALALVPRGAAPGEWQLRIGEIDGTAESRTLTLEKLRWAVAAGAAGRWALEGGGEVDLRRASGATGNCL